MIVVYRNLYSWDFWEASVASVRRLGRVVGVVDTEPWGDVGLLPEERPAVDKMLGVAARVCDMLIRSNFPTPLNQFTHICNELIGGTEPVLIMEPDMIWRQDQLAMFLREAAGRDSLCSRQVEVWKGLRHRVPERPARIGAVLWNKRPLPETLRQGDTHSIPRSQAFVHNLGFAVSPETMRVKHSIALRMSAAIGDCPPNPGWLDRWLNWKPGDRDLEIAAGYESDIPEVTAYPPEELPCVN